MGFRASGTPGSAREQLRARKYCTRLAEGEVTFAPDASCRLSGVNCEHFTGGEGTAAGASADVVKGRARMPFAATAASRCAAPFFDEQSGSGGDGVCFIRVVGLYKLNPVVPPSLKAPVSNPLEPIE
jgi:hypothetical protein